MRANLEIRQIRKKGSGTAGLGDAWFRRATWVGGVSVPCHWDQWPNVVHQMGGKRWSLLNMTGKIVSIECNIRSSNSKKHLKHGWVEPLSNDRTRSNKHARDLYKMKSSCRGLKYSKSNIWITYSISYQLQNPNKMNQGTTNNQARDPKKCV